MSLAIRCLVDNIMQLQKRIIKITVTRLFPFYLNTRRRNEFNINLEYERREMKWPMVVIKIQ